MTKKLSTQRVPTPRVTTTTVLLRDLRSLIATSRERVASQVNEELVSLYWAVGTRVQTHILQSRRAGYGEQVVATLAQRLTVEFGEGFSRVNLWNMVRLAETFDEKIVYALRRQLSWTHLRRLIYIDDPLKRDFYTEMCRILLVNGRVDAAEPEHCERTAFTISEPSAPRGQT